MDVSLVCATGQPPTPVSQEGPCESANGHYACWGRGWVAARPSWPLVDSVEGFACGSFSRQRHCDKWLGAASSRLGFGSADRDPNFERTKLDESSCDTDS